MSLASGTFVLLVRLFFFRFSGKGAACRAPEYEGEDYADGSTPETELFLQLENQRIKEAFEQLSEVQRRRLLMLAEGVSLREIARREGKDIKSIRESIEWARKKFLKYF